MASDPAARRRHIDQTIRRYFDACNAADAEAIAGYFTPDAVHYFPEGSPFGALRGARTIAECWVKCVEELGSWWTIDRMAIDVEANEAVIEWTHFKSKVNQTLRGDEWYKFDKAGSITEIKAYYACPTHPGTALHRIGGFDYAGQGYPMTIPAASRSRR